MTRTDEELTAIWEGVALSTDAPLDVIADAAAAWTELRADWQAAGEPVDHDYARFLMIHDRRSGEWQRR